MVVVITHEAELREYLSTSLSSKGYEVRIPDHRADVMSLVQSQRPPLLVVDLYVAAPSGIELLKTLRESGYQGKIIVLAGRSVRSLIPAAYSLGCNDVVERPQRIGDGYDIGPLESAIRGLLPQDVRNS